MTFNFLPTTSFYPAQSNFYNYSNNKGFSGALPPFISVSQSAPNVIDINILALTTGLLRNSVQNFFANLLALSGFSHPSGHASQNSLSTLLVLLALAGKQKPKKPKTIEITLVLEQLLAVLKKQKPTAGTPVANPPKVEFEALVEELLALINAPTTSISTPAPSTNEAPKPSKLDTPRSPQQNVRRSIRPMVGRRFPSLGAGPKEPGQTIDELPFTNNALRILSFYTPVGPDGMPISVNTTDINALKAAIEAAYGDDKAGAQAAFNDALKFSVQNAEGDPLLDVIDNNPGVTPNEQIVETAADAAREFEDLRQKYENMGSGAQGGPEDAIPSQLAEALGLKGSVGFGDIANLQIPAALCRMLGVSLGTTFGQLDSAQLKRLFALYGGTQEQPAAAQTQEIEPSAFKMAQFGNAFSGFSADEEGFRVGLR